MSILIRNGTVVNDDYMAISDILIENGKIGYHLFIPSIIFRVPKKEPGF